MRQSIESTGGCIQHEEMCGWTLAGHDVWFENGKVIIMEKDKLLYGLKDWEYLELSPDTALEQVMGGHLDYVSDSFDAVVDKITWPIQILIWKRRELSDADTQVIAEQALEDALERLDDEYGNYNGIEYSETTEAMKNAALHFAKVVTEEYIPWQCEPTGDTVEYTREEVTKLYKDG